MPNNLATLRAKLALAVSDPTNGYWTSAEMDDMVTDAVNNLWPRYALRAAPESTTITLVDGTEWYSLPAGVLEVDGLALYDASGKYVMDMPAGTWLPQPDNRLQINSAYFSVGTTLRVSGLKRYDVTTNLIPDDLVDLVISNARAEAYRRALGDRIRFKQWATSNQIQNVSVNEMLGTINEAERKSAELRVTNPRTWRRPVPARIG